MNNSEEPAMTLPTARNKPTDVTATEAAALQWANGKTMCRSTPTARWQALVGWHIETGKHPEVDAALERANTPRWEIKHQREGGAEIKLHWMLGEDVDFYPLTAGPPRTTISGCLRDTYNTTMAGLGLRWPWGQRSRFAVRGYLKPLLVNGCNVPVVLGTRSRTTDVLLAALIDHCRVCEVADQLVDRKRHPDPIALYEIALPLGAGEEQEWGKGETATVVPFVSQHPQEITVDYIKALWRPELLLTSLDQDWDDTLRWAAQYAEEQRPTGD